MSDQPTGTHDAGDDIRLLGRLIGDVLREQAGDDAFELVERVRQVAVERAPRRQRPDRRRSSPSSPTSTAIDQLHLIRAFGWLSLLANTAEDLHQERRRRFHRDAGTGSQEGSLAAQLRPPARRAASPPTASPTS